MKKIYRIKGLDCPNCAAKLEEAIRSLPEVEDVALAFAEERLTLVLRGEDDMAVHALVHRVEPEVTLTEDAEDGDCDEEDAGRSAVWIRIVTAAVFFAVGFFMDHGVPAMLLFLAAYVVAGYDVIRKAFRNGIRGQVFDENFLMSLASVGAICVGEAAEGAAVMLLYQVGEMFQDYAVDRSRRSIADLMNIRPVVAHILRDGGTEDIAPEELSVGDRILVRPGERIPVDGMVEEGISALDTSALTGEAVPRDVLPSDDVYSGAINLEGVLTLCVIRKFADSTVARILDMVENASARKARTERFITRFARVYTPAVVLLALVLAVVPPLFVGEWSMWIHRALTFLVISCPCALVLSVPLTFFAGMGCASRNGIQVKGGIYLEALSRLETVVFDKTGTLTQGTFRVVKTESIGLSADQLLDIAVHAESQSNHAISRSLCAAYGKAIDGNRVRYVQELPGMGVSALVDDRRVLAGNARLMDREGIRCSDVRLPGTVVHVAVDGRYVGYILIADEARPGAAEAVSSLYTAGVKNTAMLTGDNGDAARAVAGLLGIRTVYADLLPQDKVDAAEELMAAKDKKRTLAFVGDGINDAPVLARADVGIAMGGIGAESAIEAADVVIMDDDPRRVADAVSISRRTMTIARQNIVFALGIKAAVMVLGILGVAGMGAAVFADVGVALIAVANAMRAMRYKR